MRGGFHPVLQYGRALACLLVALGARVNRPSRDLNVRHQHSFIISPSRTLRHRKPPGNPAPDGRGPAAPPAQSRSPFVFPARYGAGQRMRPRSSSPGSAGQRRGRLPTLRRMTCGMRASVWRHGGAPDRAARPKCSGSNLARQTARGPQLDTVAVSRTLYKEDDHQQGDTVRWPSGAFGSRAARRGLQ